MQEREKGRKKKWEMENKQKTIDKVGDKLYHINNYTESK